MATLAELKPEVTLYRYSNGDAQVMILGGANKVEIWFDRSAIPEPIAERYRLLVESAYQLGVAHTKLAAADL